MLTRKRADPKDAHRRKWVCNCGTANPLWRDVCRDCACPRQTRAANRLDLDAAVRMAAAAEW